MIKDVPNILYPKLWSEIFFNKGPKKTLRKCSPEKWRHFKPKFWSLGPLVSILMALELRRAGFRSAFIGP